MIANPVLWANASKVRAIGTVLISYLGMRLWVFVHHVSCAEAAGALRVKHAVMIDEVWHRLTGTLTDVFP